MDFGLIASILVILNILVSLWCLRIIVMAVQGGMAQLDASIAAAIQSVIEGNLGEFEPPNPIQAAIAQMLTHRMENAPIQMARDASGKFSGEKVS